MPCSESFYQETLMSRHLFSHRLLHRRRSLRVWCLLGCICFASAAAAGPYAGGVVTIVTPSPPGSSFDNAARAVAEPLSRAWGVPVLVENRPGAASVIASNHVAKAAADGRTLLLAVTPTVQAQYLQKSANYDAVESFAPVAHMFDARLWFGVNARIQAKTVREFASLASTANPKFAYSSPGTGTTPHLNASLLARKAQLSMLHVPYRGIPQAVVDVAAGEVAATFASYSDLLPHVQTGKVRVLASTGAQRSPITRDIPTMLEAGYAGFETMGFGGLVVPAATPKALVDEIAADVNKVLATPEVKARLIVLGFEPALSSRSEFAKLIKVQSLYWKQVIEDSNIKPE
jgi:tripartite-type tricarboxylate transporter receptor subunit TctC